MNVIEQALSWLECDVCGRLCYDGNMAECDGCGRLCCPGCINGSYNPLSFSYWDGSVDFEERCARCDNWIPETGVYL